MILTITLYPCGRYEATFSQVTSVQLNCPNTLPLRVFIGKACRHFEPEEIRFEIRKDGET